MPTDAPYLRELCRVRTQGNSRSSLEFVHLQLSRWQLAGYRPTTFSRQL
jgi:hypothetical protein